MEKNKGLSRIFNNLFSGSNEGTLLSKDRIAVLLKTTPEALNAFETVYAQHALNVESDNFFEVNSRQAVEMHRTIDSGKGTIVIPNFMSNVKDLEARIVEELLAATEIYRYDGKQAKTEVLPALPDNTALVQNRDIAKLPKELRPQLAGNLMSVDISEPSYPILMFYYDRYLNGSNERTRNEAYKEFRRGLDILDLDSITYEIIGTNPNSMGHWFPQLVEACQKQEFFKIPATTIAKVPISLLQLTRKGCNELTPTTLSIVDKWAFKTFGLMEEKEYFIKTGTYSSKYDFRNAYVHGAKEVRELGEYLLYIHFQALQMASQLSQPTIYGASTTNEWVVREFIPDKEGSPCIYKGLPLHTEYRVFVDCDRDTVMGISPYWEPNTMKQRFGHGTDANSLHQMHDYVVFKAHEDVLMERYHNYKKVILNHIQDMLPTLDLSGQWSIDVMQNGDDFWIIDMALAENSAFYECVPLELRRPSKEDWMPKLPGKNNGKSFK